MNTDLRKRAKKDFEKDFYSLTINAGFGKTMGNMRKQRYYTFHNRKKNELFIVRSKLPYCRVFTENLLAIVMKKYGCFE